LRKLASVAESAPRTNRDFRLGSSSVRNGVVRGLENSIEVVRDSIDKVAGRRTAENHTSKGASTARDMQTYAGESEMRDASVHGRNVGLETSNVVSVGLDVVGAVRLDNVAAVGMQSGHHTWCYDIEYRMQVF
jgi:hypothetical protein